VLNIIVELSKYLIVILMILFTLESFLFFRKRDEDDKKHVLRKQVVVMLFMDLTAFAVMYLQKLEFTIIIMFLEMVGFIIALQILYRIFYRKASMILVNNMCMLLSCGFIMIGRLDFEKAQKQLLMVIIGAAFSLLVPIVVRKMKLLKNLTWLYAIAGILMLMAVLALAAISGGAKLSLEIGGVTFQLSEFAKITFVFFVAGMLRGDTDFRTVVITTAVAGAHVLILVVSKDLGSAVVFFVAYVVMLYVATQNPLYALSGLAGGSAAAILAYQVFSHVQQRVIAWKDPFSVYENEGYQIVQALFAICAGGWFGTGLYQGSPESIPVAMKDSIFAAICEELGGIFAICMLLICMNCFLMIVNISMRMSNKFYKLIAIGLGAEYAFQVFLTVGGSTKFIPLTGITLPLVSYGGSSVICTIIVFAIIEGLYILREDEGDELEKQKNNNLKKKPAKQKRAAGNAPEREKSLEERIQEQTEQSLRW